MSMLTCISIQRNQPKGSKKCCIGNKFHFHKFLFDKNKSRCKRSALVTYKIHRRERSVVNMIFVFNLTDLFLLINLFVCGQSSLNKFSFLFKSLLMAITSFMSTTKLIKSITKSLIM